ncbi:MmcQ/YjbR family DNA-binding protein [Streptosporangium sp. NBC_01810]|uniref:MmcQ/YjbR family DNA-binding protein n=1 Tax=Streptosporangium sp. NBC_01810 TaxID=2975951 RepID=UPI002DDBC101|nr:MmcQ/YjbR family DNA-binding protein [Streptosporangium sp. NBC_01810]WSA27215.1 MmcQ/YjbR family DNA-binding protein [Streptosporangium sp. NBC_01810]
MGVSVGEFLEMLDRLPEVQQSDSGSWTSLKVRGKGFGYIWGDAETVGLKATIDEQIALVAERPEVFEVQFTAGRFGWVVVHLAKIDPDELFELVTEAWCLTAPKGLVDAHEAGR